MTKDLKDIQSALKTMTEDTRVQSKEVAKRRKSNKMARKQRKQNKK